MFEPTQKLFTNVMRVLRTNKYIFSNYDYLFPSSLFFLNMLTEEDREDKERNIIIDTINEEKNSLADKYHFIT